MNNKSKEDYMFTTNMILEKRWQSGKEVYIVTLVLQKAFGTFGTFNHEIIGTTE